MDLNSLIAECTAYDFKVMLEEKKPKSWLKSVSAFANGLGGSLFFGIDSDGIVKGLNDVQHVCEAISSRIREMVNGQSSNGIWYDLTGRRIGDGQWKMDNGQLPRGVYIRDGKKVLVK